MRFIQQHLDAARRTVHDARMARARKLLYKYAGPFAVTNASLTAFAIRTGFVQAGYTAYGDYGWETTGNLFTPTADAEGNALTDSEYAIGIRIAVDPENGTFTSPYVPAPVVWKPPAFPPVREPHPTAYAALTPSTVFCVYMEIARSTYDTTDSFWGMPEQTWQGIQMYVPVWHNYQTGQDTIPIDYYEASWESPSGAGAMVPLITV